MSNNEQDREDLRIHQLLKILDHPPPELSLGEIKSAARGKRRSSFRRAAVIVLLLGAAGAASAIPGSPLRSWMSAARPPAATVVNQPATTGTLGVSVPAGERFVISFAAQQPQGEARVVLLSNDEVAVRTTDASVSFTLEEQGVIIGNAGSRASFEIEIPQNAPYVEVRLANRTVFVKEKSQLTGSQTISLAAPR